MERATAHATHVARLHARQILDSRGNPTVEVEAVLQSGAFGRAGVPSGASTGVLEALELRDGGQAWGGRGVMGAVGHVNGEIASALGEVDALDQRRVDEILIEADGTPTKERLGANAILGASLAIARAAAASQGLPLWQWLADGREPVLPVPMMNVVNGGAHADNRLDLQEFMIVPCGARSFAEALRFGVEVFQALRAVLHERGLSTTVGDEGGFAPDLPNTEAALDTLVSAISTAGYRPGVDVWIALDPAPSALFHDGKYVFESEQRTLAPEELAAYWADLVDRYPIISLEDGMAEDDWEGWQELTRRLGERLQLVGDDIFVTNTGLLRRGIELGVANSILIKPNQIGTITETLAAVELPREHGYGAVISHRSGETEDAAIAHLAVATGCGQIKAGAPSRGERVSKYNELLRIEEALGGRASFPGCGALGPPRSRA